MASEEGSRSLERARNAIDELIPIRDNVAKKILLSAGMLAALYMEYEVSNFMRSDRPADIITMQNDVAESVNQIVNPENPVMRPTTNVIVLGNLTINPPPIDHDTDIPNEEPKWYTFLKQLKEAIVSRRHIFRKRIIRFFL